MTAPAPCLAQPATRATRSLRVLLVHQAFCGPSNPGGTRHYELGRRLVGLGHQFTVVTSPYSYLTGERRELGAIPEVEVRVSPSLSGWHRSYLRRVFVFLSFTVSSLCTGLRGGPFDVVLGTSPPIFQAISAWIIAAVRRKVFVLEVRDLWPEFALGLGLLKGRLPIAAARAVESFLYRRADHIIVNSPAYRDYLKKKAVPETKISFVANGTEVCMFTPEADGQSFRDEHGLCDKFLVMYAGALGFANDIDCLLRAAERVRRHSDIVFGIVGSGKELPRLREQASAMLLDNVRFIEPQPKQRMPEVLAAADVCVAMLKNIPMFRTPYPNKVFDYMAAGRPTLLAIDGVIREVIENARGGLFVHPGDADALAAAILALRQSPSLRRDMGANARTYVERHFNRDSQATELARVLEKISSRSTEYSRPS